ncbi:MAG TPA: ABC transporter permease [Pyrinomonadaceae bacterium]|nr:ABC transporter permease [Pyrinomonadaceae bacterium]
MILNELAYVGRVLRKNPAFTLTAIVTISLGIGANTAIFSVANAVLLRPLPYENPDRLVLAGVELRKRNVTDWPFSNTDVFDLRNGAKTTFKDIAAVNTGRTIMPKEDGAPEQVRTASVTPNFFQLLGAKILVGRDFTEADGQPQPPQPQAGGAPGAQAPSRLPTIAILSYEYWQRRYGGNTAILGRGMLSGGSSGPQVVGVLAPGFELLLPPKLNAERLPDIWLAARLTYDTANRNNVSHRVIGRLKDGATLEQARAEAEVVATESRKNDTIRQTADFHFRLEPMHKYLVDEVRPAILALTGAVIFLLLIACANVANLLLVRASLRQRELAVRAALGGSWLRLVRQMLMEALLLTGAGTLLGLGLAWAGIYALLAVAPANLPRLGSIAIDPIVLAYTALAGLAAAVIFGLPPALQAARPDVMNILRGSGRTGGLGGSRRLRNIVVITEVALSFVLLIGSGLMFRSFLALQRIDPGYDSHSLLTFLLLGPRGGPQPQERATFMREVQDRLRALPGVESVTASSPFPLAGGFSPIRWGTEQALSDPTKFQAVDFQTVLPGYFETLRTPLLAGRAFTEADNAPERNVVVIDQFLAAKAFPNESVVGKRILIRVRTPEPEWVEVIGVVGHQRNTSLAEPGREQVYFTDGFLGYGVASRWAVRTKGDPAQYAAATRAEIAKFNPNLLITEMQPMEVLVGRAQEGTRFSLLLIGVFAVIAALLASVGLYGVLSNVVRQRTAEIGVRMALGATPGSISKLVVGYGLKLSAAGIVIGMVAAFGLTHVMTGMLVGIKATDPLTFVAITLLFFLIAAIAAWLPGRRAADIDPIVALREE